MFFAITVIVLVAGIFTFTEFVLIITSKSYIYVPDVSRFVLSRFYEVELIV